jgi:hypothetical protein
MPRCWSRSKRRREPILWRGTGETEAEAKGCSIPRTPALRLVADPLPLTLRSCLQFAARRYSSISTKQSQKGSFPPLDGHCASPPRGGIQALGGSSQDHGGNGARLSLNQQQPALLVTVERIDGREQARSLHQPRLKIAINVKNEHLDYFRRRDPTEPSLRSRPLDDWDERAIRRGDRCGRSVAQFITSDCQNALLFGSVPIGKGRAYDIEG